MGVVGLPNVGKSSLINSLRRCHVVNVGATPGLTRSMQEVQLDKNVKLLDCPGVVMARSGESDASIALRNCKRIEKLEDPAGPGNVINPLQQFPSICSEIVDLTHNHLTSYNSYSDSLNQIYADFYRSVVMLVVEFSVDFYQRSFNLRCYSSLKVPIVDL